MTDTTLDSLKNVKLRFENNNALKHLHEQVNPSFPI